VLDKVKELMMKAPILVLPAEKESFLLYVAATAQVVSVALVIEREEAGHALRVQCPVYFVSKVLADSQIPYPQIQKLVYATLVAQRKLRHYFKSQPVTVVSSFPLGKVIQNCDTTGRIANWALELMCEDITYAPSNGHQVLGVG
jgi:hypothetical protein